MDDASSNGMKVGIGIAGFLIGGLLGFLFRPSAFLVGRLPFAAVISRGAVFEGLDKMLVPMAQTSFNVMLAGAVIGAVCGLIVGYFVCKKKDDNTAA